MHFVIFSELKLTENRHNFLTLLPIKKINRNKINKDSVPFEPPIMIPQRAKADN